MKLSIHRAALLSLVLLATACSTGPEPKPQATYPEPVFTLERVRSDDAVDAQAVYDPWKGMNERIYNFN